MAETLTYDAGTDTVTVGDNLTESEKESLELGEALVDGHEKLLAGKYENAEQLEKAYVELQKKLGEKGTETSDEAGDSTDTEAEKETEETEETKEVSPAAELITSASEEFQKSGELTAETIEKFSSMSSKDLVEAYMQVQGDLPQASNDVDIADAQVNEIKNYAGGEKAYNDVIQWAGANLDQNSIDAFDNIISSGNIDSIKLAVSGLKSQYEAANGYEGTMVTGKAPTNTKNVFRSQQELVAAMSDRRYDNDPAYRQDVIEKLERSDNLEF